MLSDQQSDWNHGTDYIRRKNHLSLGSTGTWKIDQQSHRQPQLYQLEKKMGRQGKNTCNTTKNNRTPVKTSDLTRAGLEQPNIGEAEENDLKITVG